MNNANVKQTNRERAKQRDEEWKMDETSATSLKNCFPANSIALFALLNLYCQPLVMITQNVVIYLLILKQATAHNVPIIQNDFFEYTYILIDSWNQKF